MPNIIIQIAQRLQKPQWNETGEVFWTTVYMHWSGIMRRWLALRQFNHPRGGLWHGLLYNGSPWLWRLPREAGEWSSSSCLIELSRSVLLGLRTNLSHLHLMLPASSSLSLSLASSSRVDRCPVNYTDDREDISRRYWQDQPIRHQSGLHNAYITSRYRPNDGIWE